MGSEPRCCFGRSGDDPALARRKELRCSTNSSARRVSGASNSPSWKNSGSPISSSATSLTYSKPLESKNFILSIFEKKKKKKKKKKKVFLSIFNHFNLNYYRFLSKSCPSIKKKRKAMFYYLCYYIILYSLMTW